MRFASYLDSKFGKIGILADEGHILAIGLCEKEEILDENELSRSARKQLEEYFCKQRKQFDLPLKFSGTTFQVNVWQALLAIPYGTTSSYGEIARIIGKPKANRAVGTAIGKNPYLIVNPCHRIVGKNGLGGFALGLEAKKILLDIEGIDK